MEEDNVVCPVCTLFLRPGITLKEHLASHPKVKVIEALVRLSYDQSSALQQADPKQNVTTNTSHTNAGNSFSQGNAVGRFSQCGNGFTNNPQSAYPTAVPQNASNRQQDVCNQNWQQANNANQQPVAVNQSIIYQQIMSSSSTSPGLPQAMVNNLAQHQYVTIPVPGMFSPSLNTPMGMMNSNYMYQQQQVIMTSGNLQQAPAMACDLPVMPQMSIGVPVNQNQQNSRFNQPKCIESAPRSAEVQNCHIMEVSEASPASRIVVQPSNDSIIIRAKSPAPPKSPSGAAAHVSTIRPTAANCMEIVSKPCNEVVLIRESNYMSPYNCGPYQAITANPQSEMIIEEIDPLSTTPSSSPTPFQQHQQNYKYSTSLSASTPESPKIMGDTKMDDALVDITEHAIKEYEERDTKSAMTDGDGDDVDDDEETITPDIQCAQDLRTFCRSPVNEMAIRAPVISSCRSPTQQRYSATPQITSVCSLQDEDSFLPLECFSRDKRLDKSLSVPPFDPLTDNIVITSRRRTSHRKSSSSSHDEMPPSPTSSDGSDFSLRVRKDLQTSHAAAAAAAFDDNSQNADCFSPKDADVNSDAEESVACRNSTNVICAAAAAAVVDDDEKPVSGGGEATNAQVVGGGSLNAASGGCTSDLIATQQQDSLIDMNGVHLMLSNDFMNAQSLISQVDDFECINSNMNQNRVLMNIGGMHQELYTQEKIEDEKILDKGTIIDDLNIHADERMPPRGELSEAESNGASCDISWNRVQYQEGSSGLSNTYDLFARESWEASDASDSEPATTVPAPILAKKIPPSTASSVDDPDEAPLVIDEHPLKYKCTVCEQGFSCPKERRVHQTKEHNNVKIPRVTKAKQAKAPKPPKAPKQPKAAKPPKPKAPKATRARLTKKKAADNVPVPLPLVKSEENNFDNLFSPKLKVEKESADDMDTSTTANQLESPSVALPTKKEEACDLCDKSFTSGRKLKDHQREEHGMGLKTDFRYTCTTCNAKFITETSFNVHLKEHPLECRICGKYFFRRVNLKLHTKRHMGLKPHKCDTCSKGFITKQKLDEHVNTHTGAAPIKCTMCDETFRRHSNLVQHRNRHHLNIKKKVKDYICHCGEIYHSKKKLLWHQEIHDLKPKACTYCREKFIHMSSLTRHMRRAHNQYYVPRKEREAENVECPICKGVYLKSSIESHMRTHSGQKLYQCTICNKDFTTKWNLKLHKWTHASRTSKPYKCELCNGAFIRQTDYIAHMNSHKSVKPYTCNYCGCQFIRKYNCQRHVKEHEEGKSYNCNVCNKSFHRSYYLKEHMRVHTGARPYSCHICGKTSTTKSNHNKHVRIHHAREPVSTEG